MPRRGYIDLSSIRDEIRHYAETVCELAGLDAKVYVDISEPSERRQRTLTIEVIDATAWVEMTDLSGDNPTN